MNVLQRILPPRLRPIALFAILSLLPAAVRSPYFLHLMILVLLWVAIGAGWNILAGYAGQVSFGAAAFFGAGAYASGLLAVKAGMSPWWGLAVGPAVAVLLAFPFGALTFPLRGAYFALATLALGEIMRHVATIWESLTEGMVGILILRTFASESPYYYMALALAAASVGCVEWIVRSRLGFYLVSIREDQDAAASIGIPTTRYKMIALSLHALLTGMAGALYMCYMGYIDPKVAFSLHDISIMAILVTIVGGVGTAYGPVLGAFVMVFLQEAFRTGGFGALDAVNKALEWRVLDWAIPYIKQAHVLAFGVLVVIVILAMPNGLLGGWARHKGRKRQAAVCSE
ncbi:MAG: branched-chain amino acid ABC transporter permease [Candidatus Sumerlaeota bacterium]|nr:branched-chain amino acid ABC transporter permease [Candidatus Sumerlaeota bacterium]